MFSFKYVLHCFLLQKIRYRAARLGCCTIAQYILYFILVFCYGGVKCCKSMSYKKYCGRVYYCTRVVALQYCY